MANLSRCLFPDSDRSALAYLWVQAQDLKGKTPEEVYDLYQEAYNKILEHHRKLRAEKRTNL